MKTNLKTVTITGADDRVDPWELRHLSEKFPFVEWGILLSASRMGTPRYPSWNWCRRLAQVVELELQPSARMAIASHICGRWASGPTDTDDDGIFSRLPPVAVVSQRFQINTGAAHFFPYKHRSEEFRRRMGAKEIIYQWDGVHVEDAEHIAVETSLLYDTSGGRGHRPSGEWPARPLGLRWCGYAGGINPENVVETVAGIDMVCDRMFWIDMETGVRDDQDKFNMGAVERVLRRVENEILAYD